MLLSLSVFFLSFFHALASSRFSLRLSIHGWFICMSKFSFLEFDSNLRKDSKANGRSPDCPDRTLLEPFTYYKQIEYSGWCGAMQGMLGLTSLRPRAAAIRAWLNSGDHTAGSVGGALQQIA